MKKQLSIKLIVTLLGMGIFASQAVATQPSWNASNIRQKAMGGAGIAIVKDVNALNVNPAALANVEGILLTLTPDFEFGYNPELIELSDQLGALMDPALTDIERTTAITDLGTVKISTFLGASPGPSFAMTNFGLGSFLSTQVTAEFVRPTSPRVKVTAVADLSTAAGISLPVNLMGLDTSIGVSGKHIVRARTVNTTKDNSTFEMTSAELISLATSGEPPKFDYEVGSGVASDVGLLIKLENLRIGAVARSLGAKLEGERTSSGGVITPYSEDVPISYGVGIGYDLDLPFLGMVILAADYDIQEDSTIYKSIHMGIEKDLGFIRARGGLNQGYFVGGFGVNLFLLNFDYAYIVEEGGVEAGVNPFSTHLFRLGLFF